MRCGFFEEHLNLSATPHGNNAIVMHHFFHFIVSFSSFFFPGTLTLMTSVHVLLSRYTMLRRCTTLYAVPRPNVERRPRRNNNKKTSSSIRPGMPDMPKSAGGYIFQQLRPWLPISWQYGWRWNSLKASWIIGWVSFLGYLAYTMFFRYTDEDIAQQAQQFTYVRNEKGQVIDIGFKPIVDAGKRARKRADRLLDEDEED